MERYDVIPIDVLVNAFGDMLKHEGKDPLVVATCISRLTEGLERPQEVSESTKQWVAQCLHKPSKHEQILSAIDELLLGFGVESLNLPDGDPSQFTDEGVRMCPAFSFVNFGDPYEMTVLRDHENGQWIVSCWGDVLEWWEANREEEEESEDDDPPDSSG